MTDQTVIIIEGYMPRIAANQREKYIKDKHDLILDAAISVFVKKGFAAASVDEIATTAGIAKGTVYLYYPSKGDIFSAVLNERTFVSHVVDLANEAQEPVERVLTKIAEKYYQYTDENLPVFHMAFAEANRFPNQTQKIYTDVIYKGVETLANYLKTLSEDGRIRPLEDPRLTARAFMGLLTSYVITQYLLDGNQIFPVERRIWIKESVRLFLEGVKLSNQE